MVLAPDFQCVSKASNPSETTDLVETTDDPNSESKLRIPAISSSFAHSNGASVHIGGFS